MYHQPLFLLVSQAFVNPHEIALRIFPGTGEVESLRGFERPVRTLDGEKAELLVQIKNTLKVGGNYMAGFEFVIDAIASPDYFGTICNGYH